MADVKAEDVQAAEAALLRAKKESHAAPNSAAKRDTYQDAARRLTEVRTTFRQQEEQAGRRTGFVSGDAANTGGQ